VSALAALITRAQATHSDAVVVRRHNAVIAAWSSAPTATPILTMSCTKSIVSLAIGTLLDDGHLTSIDQPVYEIYPEWRQGHKQRITLRHVLTHTSGVQDHPNAGLELEPSPDWVQLALAAELAELPGERFRYNNKAVNLLAGIVQQACAGWFAHPRSKAGDGAWDKSPEHRVSVRCDRAASVEWSWRL